MSRRMWCTWGKIIAPKFYFLPEVTFRQKRATAAAALGMRRQLSTSTSTGARERGMTTGGDGRAVGRGG
jgi:hypothetical protein